jgi:hypothetical protein
LHGIVARADDLFNEALAAWRSGESSRALECLEANAALIVADVEARVLQAHLLALDGRWREVSNLVELIERLDPGAPDLARLRAAAANGGDRSPEVR